MPNKIQRIFQNDWMIAGLLLAVFLLANGYTFPWDDQHVEIPYLKSLIDPALYHGDYYVDGLKRGFTSVLYPILAKLITIEQIPTTYFILYLLSRYFFFFWMYKLWNVIAGDKRGAAVCVLTAALFGRVEEFLYRTFSHQELALAIIMAGFYFFYKERFFLAALLFGLAANFHALYSLFPMLYMLTYLLWKHKKLSWKTFFTSGIVFTITAGPFLIWTFKKYGQAVPMPTDVDWMELYRLACPQNFPFLEIPLSEALHSFDKFVKSVDNFALLFLMFILNNSFHDTFQKDTKTKAMLACATGLLIVAFIFSYIIPVRFILDLNLVRNGQYMLFILVGYSTLLIMKTLESKNILIGLLALLAFTTIRFGDTIGCLAIIIVLCLMIYAALDKDQKFLPRSPWQFLLIILIGLAVYFLGKEFLASGFGRISIRSLQIIAALLSVSYLVSLVFKDSPQFSQFKKIIIFIPFLLLLYNYGYYHYRHIEIEKKGGGFWQMQRNWIELQKFVKNNTPKSALILIPHDMEMGGFRIFSERPIVMEYRDCGIVGFDYPAGAEWYRRLKELEHFKVFVDGALEPILKAAITKYKVNYIVFMNYLKIPNSPIMEEVYHNEVFALYKIKLNPVQ